jgi:uncharacterized membrane protein YoaK (UPF0700 family)
VTRTKRYTDDPRHGPLPVLLLFLTLVTGLVDAVSILALGRVFVANMTGNVVFIGFALARTPGFDLVASLSALVGFVVGALVGGRVAGLRHDHRGKLLRDIAAGEFAAFAASAAILAPGVPAHAVRDMVAALLAIALGGQNAAARALAVPDLTTSVLTMTITGIAADARRAAAPVIVRRVLAVLVMLAGAAVGAALVLHTHTAVPLVIATVLAMIVAGWAALASRTPQAWHNPSV